MRVGSHIKDEVPRLSVHVGLPLAVELVLHPVHHPGLYLHLQQVLLAHKPTKKLIQGRLKQLGLNTEVYKVPHPPIEGGGGGFVKSENHIKL